jgi:hypothetical protein
MPSHLQARSKLLFYYCLEGVLALGSVATTICMDGRLGVIEVVALPAFLRDLSLVGLPAQASWCVSMRFLIL